MAGAIALPLCAEPLSRGCAHEAEKPVSVWTYSFYKTLTYEVFTNLGDLVLYYTVLDGTGAGGVAFTALNALTAAAAYYTYEMAWNLNGPPIRDLPPSAAVEVGINKALLFRVVSITQSLLIGYAFSGSVTAGVTFALISNSVGIIIYAANEYGWYAYGPPFASDESDGGPR